MLGHQNIWFCSILGFTNQCVLMSHFFFLLQCHHHCHYCQRTIFEKRWSNSEQSWSGLQSKEMGDKRWKGQKMSDSSNLLPKCRRNRTYKNSYVYWSNKTTSIIWGFMAHWKHLNCQSCLFSPFCSNSSFWSQNFSQIHPFCRYWWCWLAGMYPCTVLRPVGRCQRWPQMMLKTAWMCPWRCGDLILGHAGQENRFWNGQLCVLTIFHTSKFCSGKSFGSGGGGNL